MLDVWMQMGETLHMFVPFEEIIFVSERPTRIAIDDQNRLHHESKAALEYADGYAIFAWHGVRIDWNQMHIITAPEQIMVKDIDAEVNQETKRVMLERYGIDRYLKDGKAKLVHKDQYGKLYQKAIPNTDLTLTMVAVKNSTPEPDGSIKDYFLEVHPELRPITEDGLGEPQLLTAKNAVASTFGLRGEEFHPLVES